MTRVALCSSSSRGCATSSPALRLGCASRRGPDSSRAYSATVVVSKATLFKVPTMTANVDLELWVNACAPPVTIAG